MSGKSPYRICQTCQGRGEVYLEVKPGVWRWVKCPAGCNNGVFPIRNV